MQLDLLRIMRIAAGLPGVKGKFSLRPIANFVGQELSVEMVRESSDREQRFRTPQDTTVLEMYMMRGEEESLAINGFHKVHLSYEESSWQHSLYVPKEVTRSFVHHGEGNRELAEEHGLEIGEVDAVHEAVVGPHFGAIEFYIHYNGAIPENWRARADHNYLRWLESDFHFTEERTNQQLQEVREQAFTLPEAQKHFQKLVKKILDRFDDPHDPLGVLQWDGEEKAAVPWNRLEVRPDGTHGSVGLEIFVAHANIVQRSTMDPRQRSD